MTGRVAGKVALITGGAAGIGRATSLRLAAEGARIAVTDLNEAGGQAVAAEIVESGGEALFFKHDVTQETAWMATIEGVIAAFGRLDILVNNAGITFVTAVEETTLEQWREITAVNMDGVFLGTKHALPALRKSGGGSIVNISSILGIIGGQNISAYTATKGAVRLFTKAVALDCGKARDGIRVNSIHPGYIHTAMMEETAVRDFGDLERGIAELGKLHPIGRVGTPEDIANGVLYLASDEASFVTGIELIIDGGYTAA